MSVVVVGEGVYLCSQDDVGFALVFSLLVALWVRRSGLAGRQRLFSERSSKPTTNTKNPHINTHVIDGVLFAILRRHFTQIAKRRMTKFSGD